MKGMKRILYFCLALGMLLYAIPHLIFEASWTLQTVFSAVWLVFALIILAANFREMVAVDEAKKEQLKKVQRVKKWQAQQRMMGKRKVLQVRK
ncbi:hypothetical protein NV379_13685 [Paenibacillus sp. N1-5-1-14]|uniref:hypothetical protein n=1 Tax=Paenibacillus radicibacter TaxID=2972488 RepID=UPI002159AB62|nr:hypothetical protein [Paenibacillus radicibacter]MCR8643704.1 hypothetical protein [Paenibacillus radicibacter]